MSRRHTRRSTVVALAAVSAALACVSVPIRTPWPDAPEITLLATAELASDLEFAGTPVGGLSGIFRSNGTERYYAVSDDSSEHAPARVYELSIGRSDGDDSALDIELLSVTTLVDGGGEPFARGTTDPEGIAPSGEGGFWISSEGNANARIAPSIVRYDLSGRPLGQLTIPPHYTPEPGERGVRGNLAFESLTLSPSGRYLFTATEGALVDEGPAADVEVPTPARLLRFELGTDAAPIEYRYWADAVPRRPALPGSFRTAGLVELLALSDERLLALERSFGVGIGYSILLYEIDLAGADALPPPAEVEADPAPIEKRLLLDLGQLGVGLRNVEGMTFGPDLADGRRTLALVADNNFRAGDRTQLLLLALDP